MDLLDQEILELWRLLDQHKVAYIMVGGFATTFHGFNRATAVWICGSKTRLKTVEN